MDDHKSQIIIFCQAPADVRYILTLYEKNHTKFQISLYVINLEGIYNYFKSLHLHLRDLVLIPYPKNVPLKNLPELKRIKIRLCAEYDVYFKEVQGQTVYFFSKYFDWLTSFFIAGLSKNNKVFFINHSGETLSGSEKISGPLVLFRKLVYKYLTSISFGFLKLQSVLMTEFPVWNYDIQALNIDPDLAVITKYQVRTGTDNSKSLLLFESNHLSYDFYFDYESTMDKIVGLFRKSGYKIYLKPHPRQGYSEFLKPSIEKILPAEIPGEFFFPGDFTLIAGIDTNAIAFYAINDVAKTISLMELFKFKREDERKRVRQTQLKLSEGKINFVSSISELERMIN